MRSDGTEKGCDVKITAIVVTCNDERYLKESLESLAFCDQLIVVDLESTDSSVEIAQKAGAEVLRRERVPIVEKARGYALPRARNHWLLFQDPDEVLSASLARQAVEEVIRNPHAAIIRAPWQFYFKDKPLNCCIWGAPGQSKILLVHRERVRLSPLVHRGFDIAEGFETVTITRQGDNFIRHYWMSSWSQLIEKHRRYIRQEGEAKYLKGERFSWPGWILNTGIALKCSLIDYRGILGGTTGIFLSFFYAWYVAMSLLSLRKYQKNVEKSFNSRMNKLRL